MGEATLEDCANCGDQIGKLETPCIWKDQVVCQNCHTKLSQQQPVIATAAPTLPPIRPMVYSGSRSCPSCRKPLAENATRCPACGHIFSEQIAAKVMGRVAFWVVALIIIFLLLGMVIAAYS
jgi:predicted amidophosphoribosyltransferase